MPVLVHCPTCRNPLTVHESQAGLVVACPSCRHPLTVPVLVPVAPVAPVAPAAPEPEENPFETPSEPTARRSSKKRAVARKPLPGTMIFFIVVGVLVAVVMALILYDRIEAYYDKQRFRSVTDEWLMLYPKREAREHELEARDKRLRDPLNSDRQTILRADAQWKKLDDRMSELDFERSKLLRAHPEWGR